MLALGTLMGRSPGPLHVLGGEVNWMIIPPAALKTVGQIALALAMAYHEMGAGASEHLVARLTG